MQGAGACAVADALAFDIVVHPHQSTAHSMLGS